MCICPDSAGLRTGVLVASLVIFLLSFSVRPAVPCSCFWRGPFLSVARECPLVVYGRILRHNVGARPSMDVLVLETLRGGLLDSGLRIQMGDGLHCRPETGGFPVGSEWILAVNGPGSKPGEGLALSICGEYWLGVRGSEAMGSINGRRDEANHMPLEELKERLRHLP